MLKHIHTQQEYKIFLSTQKYKLGYSSINNHTECKKIRSMLWKLSKLETDSIHSILLPLYSSDFGRPAIDPLIFIRSFLLMLKLKVWSIDEWCHKLKTDPVLQYVIGSWSPPSTASHYNFINRVMHDNPNLKTYFPAKKNSKNVRLKIGRNEKWENYDDEDTNSLTAKYSDGAACDRDRVSYSLEKIFSLLAVNPSVKLGLINIENLILSGDGSCIHIHSSPHGHKVNSVQDETCNYRYTAPDADFGWDSDLEKWYFGYTLYNISCYNPVYKTDLPVYLSLGYASTHDALTTITSTARMLDMNPSLKPRYMCFDSAMDSANIYKHLRHNNIIPIIDWNPRHNGSKNPYAKFENIDSDGTPLCAAGYRMARDGYDSSKMATKFRCPAMRGKVSSCPLFGKCTSSTYGRVIKIYDKTDFKLFGPVPYKSNKWKSIYENRTCTERINNRILNDYGLHKMFIRNRSKFQFFSVIAGISIHMDAWMKAFNS